MNYSTIHTQPKILKDGKEINPFNEFGTVLMPILQKYGIDENYFGILWQKLASNQELSYSENQIYSAFMDSTERHGNIEATNFMNARREFFNSIPGKIKEEVFEILLGKID